MTPDSRPRARAAALVCGFIAPVALVIGLVLPSSVQHTDAEWTRDFTAEATISTEGIPAPALTKRCEFKPGLLGVGARVLIHWSAPEGYALGDVVIEGATTGLGAILSPITGFNLYSSTQENPDGTYTTTIPANLLGGLLGFGTELNIALSVEHDSGWHSERVSVIANAGLVAGVGGRCAPAA